LHCLHHGGNLAVNLPQNPLVTALVQRLFPATSAITDTVRSTALRYMLESIADTRVRQRFFTTLLKTLRGTIPISAQMQERFVKTMQLYSQVLGNEITVGEQAQNEDNPLSPPGMMFSPDQLPERDLEALRGRLREAKTQFAVLVDEMDYNPYVDDAIDRIASINKWLE